MLIDLARPTATAAMLAELADHLRLPSGFADDAERLPALERCLDTGVAVVEAQTRRALLTRAMAVRVTAWWDGRVALPRGPVQVVEAVELDDGAGVRAAVDPALWRLVVEGDRAWLAPRAGRSLPTPPREGFAETRFVAGFGPDWSDAPGPLRHAALLVAAACHEGRENFGAPPAARALMAPYRPVRL